LILITGRGFIGNAIANSLGDTARVISRNPVSEKDIKFDMTDVGNVETFIKLIGPKKITHIVHTSAITPWANNPDYRLDLVMAKTLSLLCNHLNVGSLILLSGWNVYDAKLNSAPFTEDMPIGPKDDYGKSKAATEMYFEKNLKTTKLVCLRLSSIYGPGQYSNGLIPNLVTSALNDHSMTIEAEATRRDYLFIDDLIDTIKSTVSSDIELPRVINIGSGKSASVGEVAATIKDVCTKLTNKEVRLSKGRHIKESSVLDNELDIKKAKSLGLLSNTHKLKDGIEEYVKWRMK